MVKRRMNKTSELAMSMSPRRVLSGRPAVRSTAARTIRSTRSSAKPKVQSVTRSKGRKYVAYVTYRRPKTTHGRLLDWSQQCLLAVVVSCFACVGISLIVDASYNPESNAHAVFEQLANEYYTERLHPELLEKADNPEVALARYSGSGFPAVRLAHILSIGTNRKDYAKDFSDPHFVCDPDQTLVRFYPYAPWGPTDFSATYEFVCEDIAQDR